MYNPNNLLLKTDSYKVTHWRQFPKNTTKTFYYWESRVEKPKVPIVFFGLQALLKLYGFDKPITKEDIEEAKDFWGKHFGDTSYFNYNGWRAILEKHGGFLPLVIKAVSEGSTVSSRNILMSVSNTDDESYWLPGYFETLLSHLWYTSTIATHSKGIKESLKKILETTDEEDVVNAHLPFMFHDFGYRGSTSDQSAMLGGMAHLLSFKGTDTAAGIVGANLFYEEDMAGYSVAAGEHSVATSWGKDHENDYFRHMLQEFPKGIVSVISDSYDIRQAIVKYWGSELKDLVIQREGKLVIRPDSGDPVEEIVPWLVDLTAKTFGTTTNSKGFQKLPAYVGLIQGDGIKFNPLTGENTALTILNKMKTMGYAASNIVFGSGGGLLQNFTRDTYKFVIKCSAVQIDGVWHEVFKDPITAPGKRSKAGLLKLVKTKNLYETVVQGFGNSPDELVPYLYNGKIQSAYKWKDIIARVHLDYFNPSPSFFAK